MADRLPWSAGQIANRATGRPSSRVRVYRRADVPDRIMMSFGWDRTESGRVREHPLPMDYTEEQAIAAAREAAAKREREIAFGLAPDTRPRSEPVTLGEVREKYLASETAKGWSAKHRQDVTNSLDFWALAVGEDRNVLSLTPAEVEKAAGRAGREKGFSPGWAKKRLKHLRAAVRWGKRKARLYDRDPMDGIDYPEYEPDTDHLIYSEDEVQKLWAPHPDVDWRVTLLVNIAADTGRRIHAMLALRTEDVQTDGARVYLRFRKEYDKMGRTSLVPISQPTAELLADALERSVVMEHGWIFPEGRLEYDDPRDKPWGTYAAINGLHDAEEALGVEYVKGRAYHGLKRRHITTSWEISAGDAGLVGDMTGNVSPDLLRRVYRKGQPGRLVKHVDAVRKAIRRESGDE